MQFKYLAELNEQNPAKVGSWFVKGTAVHERSAKIFNEIESLKKEIAAKADGKGADPLKLVNQDDLEASSVVMLNPATNKGRKLRQSVDEYRDFIASNIADPEKRKSVVEMLSTTVKAPAGTVGPVSWETKMFDNMPAVAAVTLLTKLQNDIRQAENETMTNLITNVDIGDVRVNQLNAYVIPNSNMIIRGGKYSAKHRSRGK